MKTLLVTVYKSLIIPLIVFFAPIAWMVFLVGLATVVDTCFGIWRVRKKKEKFSSKLLRKGLVPKVTSYVAMVLILFTIDYHIVNELTKSVIDIEFVTTKLLALALIYIETKSVDESWEAVKGYSFLDKILSSIRKIKKLKNEVNE